MKRLGLALVFVLLTCCSTSTNVSGERRNVGNVTMTFTVVPSTAKPGQTVHLTIRLVNNGGTEQTLTFSSGKKYDFWVTDGSAEVWRWSAGQVFTQDVNHQEIGGQTGAVFAESFTPPRTGKFVAHAEFNAQTYSGEMKGALTVT